jgi:hypothetical protein
MMGFRLIDVLKNDPTLLPHFLFKLPYFYPRGIPVTSPNPDTQVTDEATLAWI